jgi:amidase
VKPSEYASYDATGLAALVKRGDVRPIELVEAAIARIEEHDGELNAVVDRWFDDARSRAESGALPEGPFAGVPFLLKDNGAFVAGRTAPQASRLLAQVTRSTTGALVQRFDAAGLITLGRSNAPEFGIYGVTEPELYGACRNPWNTAHTPGGSSGGAGAAVAAGYVPVAHAGDGGGSIRIPASHCGLVGLKPSRGRTPSSSPAPESWSGYVSEFAVTRSVRDAAALLDAVHGLSPGALYSAPASDRPFAAEVGADPGRLRIAFTTASLLGRDTAPENREAVERAAALAESLGHEVAEACPRFDADALRKAYLMNVAANVAALLEEAEAAAGRAARSDVELPTALLGLIGGALTAGELVVSQRMVQRANREVAAFFQDWDVLLTATTAQPPVLIGAFALSAGERLMLRGLRRAPLRAALMAALDQMSGSAFDATPNTQPFNQTGQPAISLPLHMADGLPIGTQWVGRYGDEGTLIRLAAQLEATESFTPLPALD